MSQTVDWHQCGSSFYRKFKIYDMKWQNLSMKNVLVAAEKFGGHIAIANALGDHGERKSQCAIIFYTSTGHVLNKIQWKNGPILGMDWSVDTEQLVVVNHEGRVFFYTLFGEELEHKRFTMGQESLETKVAACQLFDSYTGVGLCCLTNMNRYYLVNNLEEPKLWRMPEVTGKTNVKPTSWTVASKDRVTKVVCTYGNEIYSLEQGKNPEIVALHFHTQINFYIFMALSPNKSKLAFLSESGTVQICSTDFSSFDREFNTGCRTAPKSFCWCGDSALVLLFQNNLELVSIIEDSLQFSVEPNTHILEEIDGLRLFDSSYQEFLCKVPDCAVQTFQVAALAPSATLLEAWKEYDSESYRAYDYIKMTKGSLEQAVEKCIEAACQEYNVDNQKLLLKAASLGKLFATEDLDPNVVVTASRILKILNSIRNISIGVPITFLQYQKLSCDILINRLILRGQWPLAIAACQHLKLSNNDGVQKVLSCWVKQKIFDKNQRDSPEILAEKIGWKLAEYPNVSLYAEAAQWAVDTSQKDLATLLLENEPNLKLKVTMLMKLDRNEKALSKVCESGDHDLIAFVILHLRQTLEKKGDLDLILRKFPLAFAIYKKYCAEENPQLYKALLKQTDDFASHACCWIKEANCETTFDAKEKIDALKEAEHYFKQSKDDFYCHQLQDQCKLLKYQAELEEKFGEQFLDLSLKETLTSLISKNDPNNLVPTLKKDFQITDKQFWWWKIEAFGRTNQWAELEKFAYSRKSPVGYMPFLETAVKYGSKIEAEKYLNKIGSEEKVKGYIKTGRFEDAANLAFAKKDVQSLNRILSCCSVKDKIASEKISQMKQQLIRQK